VAEHHEARYDPLYPLYILNRAHPRDGQDLLWVVFDAALGDDEPKQHAPRDPKNTFLKVEFDAICSEFHESFLHVDHELVGLFGFDYDVIYVSLNGFTDELSKTLEHTLLVRSPWVFQLERHHDVTE
jgi:hypothetical protein